MSERAVLSIAADLQEIAAADRAIKAWKRMLLNADDRTAIEILERCIIAFQNQNQARESVN